MGIYTREFMVNGQSVIMGHDRKTGKRYYIKDDQLLEVKSIEIHLFTSEENYIFLVDFFGSEYTIFYDVEDPESVRDQLKAIFWIE
jgi:hypothetical protein